MDTARLKTLVGHITDGLKLAANSSHVDSAEMQAIIDAIDNDLRKLEEDDESETQGLLEAFVP